jgi:hypothetical protein
MSSADGLLAPCSESNLITENRTEQLQEEEVDLDGVENDCSFNLESIVLSPPREKLQPEPHVEVDAPDDAPRSIRQIELPSIVELPPTEEPLNLSVKTDRQLNIYQPEVSDIRYRYSCISFCLIRTGMKNKPVFHVRVILARIRILGLVLRNF